MFDEYYKKPLFKKSTDISTLDIKNITIDDANKPIQDIIDCPYNCYATSIDTSECWSLMDNNKYCFGHGDLGAFELKPPWSPDEDLEVRVDPMCFLPEQLISMGDDTFKKMFNI